MRLMIVIVGLILSTTVYGFDLVNASKAERCNTWSMNAKHGATQFLRGAPRQIQYISRPTLIEMIEHFGGVAGDKVYILEDKNYTSAEREFLDSSTLFGYDAMSKWKDQYSNDQPRLSEWVHQFETQCMAKDSS